MFSLVSFLAGWTSSPWYILSLGHSPYILLIHSFTNSLTHSLPNSSQVNTLLRHVHQVCFKFLLQEAHYFKIAKVGVRLGRCISEVSGRESGVKRQQRQQKKQRGLARYSKKLQVSGISARLLEGG